MEPYWLPKSVVWTTVRAHLDPILMPLGFRRKGNSIYWRISDQLVQFVLLERPTDHINVSAYLLPLCIPNQEGDWILASGDRLGWFAGGPDYRIDLESETSLGRGLTKTHDLLIRYAIPWMDKVNSIQRLVDWYWGRTGGGTGTSGMHLHGRGPIWRGYCLTYLGRGADAIRLIEANFEDAILPSWPDYAPTRQLLALLRTDPEGARSLVLQWCQETQQALGLGTDSRSGSKSVRSRGQTPT